MIDVQLATIEDLEEVVCGGTKERLYNVDSAKTQAFNSIRAGRAFTLRDSLGRIGVLCGFYFERAGTAYVWALTTKHVDESPLAFTRACYRQLDKCQDIYKVHRVEIVVKTSFVAGHKWARALGFEAEGNMRQYGPDKSDYTLYGRIR